MKKRKSRCKLKMQMAQAQSNDFTPPALDSIYVDSTELSCWVWLRSCGLGSGWACYLRWVRKVPRVSAQLWRALSKIQICKQQNNNEYNSIQFLDDFRKKYWKMEACNIPHKRKDLERIKFSIFEAAFSFACSILCCYMNSFSSFD